MYYGQLIEDCVSDGPGFRVSLYVSGCRNCCKGCHNPEGRNFNFGQEFTEATIDKIINLLNKEYISGLTLCGGEPMEPENQEVLIHLIKRVKERFPNKSIWCYTGYEWEDVKDSILNKYIDVMVVGPFVLKERDITCDNLWRGSRNQRIVDVQRSLNEGEKVLVKDIPNNC